MAGLGIQTRGTGIARVQKKGGKAFPDLNKDGKVTKADIITARMSSKKKGKMMKGKR